MDAVYEAIADAASAAAEDSAFTTDDAKSFLYAMLATNFGDLGIAGNTTTYYNTNGTVRCECEYESAGAETVAFGEEGFEWYKFELTSEDAACSEYKYLILTEVHSHEDAMVHFHMRYGNTSFDDLINNTNYAMWWPTFGVEGTTAEEVADGFAEGAEMMGYMMLASQRPSLEDPWENFDPNHLPTQIINLSGEYNCTNEAMYLDIEGNLIPELPPYQEKGAIMTFEQHGSLLMVTVEEGGEEIMKWSGSTVGDSIMLTYAGYNDWGPGMGMMRSEVLWAGKIHGCGEGIVMNAILRVYDSDNNLVLRWAGTQVLERVGE